MRRWLLLAVSSVLALVAGEVATRALKLAPLYRPITVSYDDHESVYRRSRNPILGYELKSNYDNPSPDNNFTCRRTNAHGQRDVERAVRKPPGVRRVILLGDSIVESTEIPDINDVMHRQLEELYPDGSTEVLNFGVGGYCTLAEVELLRVKGLQFDPDIVIVVFFLNDFENFNSSVAETLTDHDAPSWLFKTLFSRSHLFRATLVNAGWTSFGMRQDPVVRNKSAIGSDNVVQGLAMLRQLADTHDFRPAVAVWPVFMDDGIYDPHPMPDGDTLVVEHLAHAAGIPCFRLSSVFWQHYTAAELVDGPRLAYTVGDSWHANETGSYVAALALKQVVAAVTAGEAASDVGPASSAAFEKARLLADRASAGWTDMSDALASAGRNQSELRPQKSIQHLEDAVRLRPHDVELVTELAMMHVQVDDLPAALSGFRTAAELQPDSAVHRISIASILSMQGRDEEALSFCRDAAVLDPDDPGVWETWAKILAKLDRPNEAMTSGEGRGPSVAARQVSCYILCHKPFVPGHGERKEDNNR